MTDEENYKAKIRSALDIIFQYGGIDGGHHKQWVLDQVVRVLSDDYEKWLSEYEADLDNGDFCEWDKGTPP